MVYKLDRPDYCSEHGARLLVDMISAYWTSKGKTVAPHIEKGPFMSDADRAAFWCVRSNMVRGLPPSNGADHGSAKASWYGGRRTPPAKPEPHDD